MLDRCLANAPLVLPNWKLVSMLFSLEVTSFIPLLSSNPPQPHCFLVLRPLLTLSSLRYECSSCLSILSWGVGAYYKLSFLIVLSAIIHQININLTFVRQCIITVRFIMCIKSSPYLYGNNIQLYRPPSIPQLPFRTEHI